MTRKGGKSRVERCLEHSIRQDLKIKRLQERLRAIEELLRVSRPQSIVERIPHEL